MKRKAKSKPIKSKSIVPGLVKVGVVGVDSGQVLLCDPCYLDSLWKLGTEPNQCTDLYKDTKTGKTFAYAGFKIPKGIVDVLFNSFEQKLSECNNMTANECLQSRRWHVYNVWRPKGYDPKEFSYMGCCQTTVEEGGFGQLNYAKGHPGVGVVSRTLCGDGSYPVFADVDENGHVKRLIVDFEVLDYNNNMTVEEYKKLCSEKNK